jgi:hypothetical protein
LELYEKATALNAEQIRLHVAETLRIFDEKARQLTAAVEKEKELYTNELTALNGIDRKTDEQKWKLQAQKVGDRYALLQTKVAINKIELAKAEEAFRARLIRMPSPSVCWSLNRGSPGIAAQRLQAQMTELKECKPGDGIELMSLGGPVAQLLPRE